MDYSDKSSRGNVYVVWADRRNGTDDIWFQRSTDHGNTWMPQPIMVNDVESNQQYWPAIQCDENGRIAVVFYDEREGPYNINAYLAYSDDQGNTWTNVRLSNESFSASTPNSNVRFGDYIHVDAYAGKIIPVWTDDRAGAYDQEIYMSLVEIPVGITDYPINTEEVVLYQNYPNPLRGHTMIHFDLSHEMKVKGEVFNSAGQLVDVPFDAVMPSGKQQYRWNAGSLPPGIYYLRLTAGNSLGHMKLILR